MSHGQAKPVKTFALWQASGVSTIDRFIFPNDHVDGALVDHFRNLLPPVIDRHGYLQAGGEASQVRVKQPDGCAKHLPTYLTFTNHGDYWTFCGICFRDDTVDLTGIYEVTLRPNGSYADMRRMHEFSEKALYDQMFRARQTPDLLRAKALAEVCRNREIFSPLDCSLWNDPVPGDPFPYGFCRFDDPSMLKLFFQFGNWAQGVGVLYHDLAFVNQISGVGDWWTLKYDCEQGCWVHFESIRFYSIIASGSFEALIGRLDAASIQQCKDCTY